MRHHLGRVQQAAEQLALPFEDSLQDGIAAILFDFTDPGHETRLLVAGAETLASRSVAA
jgi:hypothetical protein